MRLTIVGSSDAFNACGRSHSCYLLEGEGFGPIMIDFGATSLAALRRLGREPTEIRAFAITHLHGDHIGGFPFLVIDGMFNAVRRDDLEVLGPVGVEHRVAAFVEAAYGDLSNHPRPYDLTFRELEPGQEVDLAGARVRGYPAEHMDPPERPLCLRITTPSGHVIAFSGDTLMCDALLEAGAGADVLVAECSGMAPPMGRHCTWVDWRDVLPRCTARRVVLSHLGRAVREQTDALLEDARTICEGRDGPVLTFADDGLVIELDA